MASRRKAEGKRSGVRRGEITEAEAAQTAEAAANGGFTLRVTGRGAGRQAKDALSTAFAPEEGRGAEVALDPTRPGTEQIQEFNAAHANALNVRGANMGMGGWQDDTGLVKQDVTVITPRTHAGLEAAMQIGSYGRQESIGNIGRKGYVGDIVIPPHLHRGQFAYHESEGIDPLVEREGNIVRITPSRKEMASVEAQGMMEGWFKDEEGNVIPPPFSVPPSKMGK